MKFNLIATVFAAAFLFVVSGGNAGAFTVTCPTIVKLNGTRYLPVVGVNDQGFGQAALGSDNGITCRYAVSYRPVTPPTGTPPACPPLKVTATFSGGSNATWTPGVPTFTETGSLQTARSPNGAVHTTCQYAGIASGRGLSASPTEALAPNNTVSVTTSVPTYDTCAKASPHSVTCTAPTPTCQTSVTGSALSAASTNAQNYTAFSGNIWNPTKINGAPFNGLPWWPHGTTSFQTFATPVYQCEFSPAPGWTWTAPSTGAWTNSSHNAVQCQYQAVNQSCSGNPGYHGSFSITCSGTSCGF